MKNLKDFIIEGRIDIDDVHDVLSSILSWNDDEMNNVLLELDKTHSIYQALDTYKMWDSFVGEFEQPTTVNELKSLVKKNDKKLSDDLLKELEESIKELK